jgi:two-component system chemotaxis sensor kinase CheA
MKFNTSQFRALFFEEAAEHLEAMETGLVQIEETGGDPELLNGIFRAAHSIKGTSATFGLADVAAFTHALESVLDRLRNGALSRSHDLTSLLLRAADVLRGLIAAAQHGAPAPEERAAVEAQLKLVLGARVEVAPVAARPPAATAGGARDVHVRFVPDPDLFRRGADPLFVLRDLAADAESIHVTTGADRLPPLAELDPEHCYLSFEVRLRTARSDPELRDRFAFVEDGSEIVIAGEAPAAAAAPPPEAAAAAPRERSSIRVPTEKVDKIINLVGEIVIAQSMILDAMQRVGGEGLAALREAVGVMERNTRDLQERAMSVRMMPMASVFQRLPRVVREIGGALGKEVDLVLVGEEIELDKGVIEGLADPLIHLLRNAVDHGIESPAERRAAGKPERGTVTVVAAHRGGTVHIQVGDDGRGLDAARIRGKAIAAGLIDAGAELTQEQIHALLFRAGFSTADKVSDVSGRGVGMDVVKRNIEALSGSVGLDSVAGKGTTCTIRLPLTLAILEGLSVRVADQCFIVPLINVVESFKPRCEDVQTIFGQAELLRVRGETLPIVRLHRCFGLPAPEDEGRCLVTVVEHGARRAALVIDELLGQSQVVLKSLEANYRRVQGIGGATILGDGRVALVLDLQAIVRGAGGDGTLRAA